MVFEQLECCVKLIQLSLVTRLLSPHSSEVDFMNASLGETHLFCKYVSVYVYTSRCIVYLPATRLEENYNENASRDPPPTPSP